MNVSDPKYTTPTKRGIGSLWWLILGAVLGYVFERIVAAVHPYGKAAAWLGMLVFSLVCWAMAIKFTVWAVPILDEVMDEFAHWVFGK